MIKPIEFTEYANTYYVEVKDNEGCIDTYEKISGESPIKIARLFKPDAKPCKKENATIYVISNAWRFGSKVRKNYYN